MKVHNGIGSLVSLAAPIVLGAALSSCELEIDVDLQETITIHRNEVWEADMTARFARELVDALSPGQELGPEGEEEFIQQYLPDLQGTGVEISWESQTNEFGDLTYFVQISGKGLDTLKSSLFDEETHLESVEIDGKRRIVFSHPVGYPESILRNYTITLIGGSIISSNGQLIDDNSVRWVNPSGRIEAVLAEKFELQPLEILLILGACFTLVTIAVLGIAGLAFFVRRGRSDPG